LSFIYILFFKFVELRSLNDKNNDIFLQIGNLLRMWVLFLSRRTNVWSRRLAEIWYIQDLVMMRCLVQCGKEVTQVELAFVFCIRKTRKLKLTLTIHSW